MARGKRPEQTVRVYSQEDLETLIERSGEVPGNLWKPNTQQGKVLTSLERELFYAGSRYGGKSEAGRYWMVSGNPHLENYDEMGLEIPTNISYMYNPNFVGVVLRKNVQDLREWVEKSKRAYEAYGVYFVGNPDEFRNDCGARIYLGHFQDRDSWERFQGGNITRLLLEEAGQFREFDQYQLFTSSCRSPYDLMRAQILATANPGGPGQPWLYDRFIEPKDHKTGKLLINPETGEPYKPEETIWEAIENPFTGEIEYLSRKWVPSNFQDNEFAMKDKAYLLSLASIQDDKTRRAFVFGDWKAFKGGYLTYIPEKHEITEENIGELNIKSWNQRVYSLDIGFNHEAGLLEGIKLDSGQTLLYKEEVGSGIDPYQLGINAARFMKNELLSKGIVHFYISHDAFNMKIGGITEVELLQKGFEYILGKGHVHIPSLILKELEERASKDAQVWTPKIEAEFKNQLSSKLTKGILIKKAPKGTSVTWKFFSSQFNTEGFSIESMGSPDWNVASSLARKEGPEVFITYLKSFQAPREKFPKVLFYKPGVPRLISSIPKLIHSDKNPDLPDDKHFFGRDILDACLYLIAGSREESPLPPPVEAKIHQSLEILKSYYPELNHDLTSQARIASDILAREKPKLKPIRPRIGFRRH